ncbi:hypothetical protein L486_01170 [Kwoniella mangroviensis CBS 10435]|uniref:Uncharacterized protein n=1 Tax=Kwoniella mangroviensis CBS 10435 TaxID=1331196 RepID=A0A1B9J180_9TREE|nr:hypothetical protein L486_01170 [Kwoniella mangroviensis CBS 10435]
MSAFLSGAAVECGPSNVLKNVQGRLDRDTSLQQDRLVSTPNVASSSKQPFKSQTSSYSPPAQIPQNAQSPFDITSLRQHLPPAQTSLLNPQASSWANAFSVHTQSQAGPSRPQERTVPRQSQAVTHGWSHEYAQAQDSTIPNHQLTRLSHPLVAPWKRPQHHPAPDISTQLHQAPLQHHPPPHVTTRPSSVPARQVSPISHEPLTESQDILAKTAQTFVDELEGPDGIMKANPKLAQSNFISLLRKVGNGNVVIDEGKQTYGDDIGEGANLVERGMLMERTEEILENDKNDGAMYNWAESFNAASPKDKVGRIDERNLAQPMGYRHGVMPSLDRYETPAPNLQTNWESSFQDQEALIRSSENASRKSVHFDSDVDLSSASGVPKTLEEALRHTTSIPGMGASWEEEGLDLDDFNDEVFMGYNGMMKTVPPTEVNKGVGNDQSWGRLQNDWENFQRAEPAKQQLRGMGVDDRYLFQRKNPYFGVSEVASYWEMAQESPTLKGVLELEAAVQNSPSSFEAWYNLGLKQQENEREESAILALSKTIQLEPDYRPAYLALAVSYTNESEIEAACTMLDKWISLGEGLGTNASRVDAQEGGKLRDRAKLIERLIDVARQDPENVDSDVQVALGVLFNATEEYQKAEDCFLAALSVRPDDWLLYNRLGATLANSGRSNEAIQYYHKALELHPNFVRALFNLAISYINLGHYSLSAQSALDALRLQHSDASEGYSFGQEGSKVKSKGVTSEALWNALRSACIHMNRHDIVGLVAQHDLSGFPMSFGDLEAQQ